MKSLKAVFSFLLIALMTLGTARAGQVTGTFATPGGSFIQNATVTFTLSQLAVKTDASQTVAPSTVSCYTSVDGSLVGLPNPQASPVLSSTSGSMTAGTYYEVITYWNASGETLASPEQTVVLSSSQGIQTSSPGLQPAGASGYKIYVGIAPGGEVLQATVTGFATTSIGSLIGGSSPPISNSTPCNIAFNDTFIPAYTTYRVSALDSTGSPLPGFPQSFYLQGSTVNLNTMYPASGLSARFPQPIVASPINTTTQSINSNLSLNGHNLLGVGASTLSSVNNQYMFNGSELGGVCDGATDDSAHWTAAMTKAAALGGLRLIFPVGKTCFFAAGISVTQPNVALDCAGGFSSTFHNAGAATPTCELLFAAGNNITGIDTTATVGNISSSVTIKHLYIKGQASGTGTGNGIHLTSNAPWLEQNVIEGFGNCGVSVDSSGTNANVNFFHLVQNYSKSNKGDGYCFNGLTNGNANVGVVEQNTAYNNGGWGFDLLSGGTFKPSANLFITNHCVSNTSGCFNVNGTGNTFIGNYTEVSSSGMTLNAGSAANYIVNGAFGGMQITDNGILNTIISMNCGVTLGTVSNAPCQSNQVNIAPIPGSASTKIYSWATGRQSTDSFDLSDIVNGKLYINFTSGTTPIWFFQNAVNLWLAEGTCAGANAGVSELCADAATHRFALSNNGVARSPLAVFSDNLGNFASGGTVTPALYASLTSCANSLGNCAAAPAGRVSIAAAATTVTVATTAVTANSEIFIQEDATLGAALSVTCNTTAGRSYMVTTRTAGTSFVITASAAPAANPACLSYHIIN